MNKLTLTSSSVFYRFGPALQEEYVGRTRNMWQKKYSIVNFETCNLLQEQVIGTYVYSQKHNYIPYSTFTITTVQLHVLAINVGHLQVVHEAPYDKLYLHVSGGGARSRFVFVERVWIGSI